MEIVMEEMLKDLIIQQWLTNNFFVFNTDIHA